MNENLEYRCMSLRDEALQQHCPVDGAEEVYGRGYDTAGNYHWYGTITGHHVINREQIDKVIKGLECHGNASCENSEKELCPYWSYNDGCSSYLLSDAVEILKLMKSTQERRANNGAFD